MSDTSKLRSALSDLFAWSAWNIRDSVDESAWMDIRRHFSELKGVLDEQHAKRERCSVTPDDVLDSLGIK
ncbi:MAG: hypothetical protein R3F02_02270 [Thiolinea sp.]